MPNNHLGIRMYGTPVMKPLCSNCDINDKLTLTRGHAQVLIVLKSKIEMKIQQMFRLKRSRIVSRIVATISDGSPIFSIL